MHTNLNARSRKIFLVSMLGGIILILFSMGSSSPVAHAQEQGTPPPRAVEAVNVTAEKQHISPYYVVETTTLPDGTLIEKQKVNGPPVPPAGFEKERQPVGLPKSNGSTGDGIGDPGSPAYVLGCSSTAALDVARRQDNPYLPTFSGLTNAALSSSIVSLAPGIFLPNLYTGPTNGGVMPGDNSPWPTWTDITGAIYSNNPLVASHKGVDGRTTRGTFDDYWVSYNSTAADPYITGGWQPHPQETLGDYMLTGQSAYHNNDGFTTFITYPGSPKPFTCDKSAIEKLPDGSLGRRLFYESKGYAVAECYNQPTDNVVAGGFSLAQFKAEINAGRPVMLGLEGHNVVGIGYDTASNQIYIHDGWDYNTHTMPWGGSYAGLPLRMVSMVNPIPPAHTGDFTISGYVGVPNATVTYPGGSTTASITGYYNFSVGPGWSGRVTPSKPGYTFQPQYKDYSNVPDYQTKQNYAATPIQGSNLLQDPSFELGSPNPYWAEFSTNFGTPLCNKASSFCQGAIPRTGSIWGWFGGIASNETATLSQTLTIPSGSAASLDFYLWISDAGAGSNTADVFTVKVDGTIVFSANATQINSYSTYIPVSVNVTPYANGAQHTIAFGSVTSGQIVSFHLDDVSLAVTLKPAITISGNINVAEVKLSYLNGMQKTVISQPNGDYSLSVPASWVGAVTPSHACYTFTPLNRSYNNPGSNQSGQNYTPSLNGSGCADINAVIGGTNRGRFGLLPGASTRVSFAGLNDGPVKIMSTNAISLIGAERVIYKVNGVNTSFWEMMALPNSQLTNTYWLPWYNNVDLDTQLRIGNVSGSTATVHVLIGGQEMTGSPFSLGPGASTRKSFAANNGPVKIVSNVNIVAAERVIYKVNNVNTSFSELMGLPNSQLTNTYWLPWYDNVSLDSQLRFANVGSATATIHVLIHGVEMAGSPFTLAVGQSTRQSFAVNDGPVKIISDQNIVAAERIIYKANGVNTSFSEMMALPNIQLNTTYWLPWYNNLDLDTQLRIGNVSGAAATVHVLIGAVEMSGSPFTLPAGQSLFKSYAVNNGPVKIISDQNIVVTEREIYKVNGTNTSFSEMMALPNNQLDNIYWLPWYNNMDLDTQLRFGVP